MGSPQFVTPSDSVEIREVAEALNLPVTAILSAISKHRTELTKPYYSYEALKLRWNCSIGTVYNVLNSYGARVLDLGMPGRSRGKKKLVPAATVDRIETTVKGCGARRMKKALDRRMPIVYTYSMKRISMFLTEAQIERLSALARSTGLKMSELTRRAIYEFLKRQKEGK